MSSGSGATTKQTGAAGESCNNLLVCADMATTIDIRKNGPYLVKEPCTLLDGSTGREIPIEKFPIALCRCGASKTKPFCDGSHSKNGFDGTCE
jgi:CDGSH-type Zn-finger protein